MIFIGDSALLQEAILAALDRGHRVDRVFGNSERLAPFCARHGIPFGRSAGINESPERVTATCSDGIVFSIDNALLLKPRLLDSPGISFFGIHSGIIPIHRGNPVVALIFAILHGSKEYGVSLFKLDAGIDTGEVLAIKRFALSHRSRLHEVVVESSLLCHEMFVENLDRIVSGALHGEPVATANTKAYSLRDVAALESELSHPAFERATDFGVLDGLLPDEHSASLLRMRERAWHEAPARSAAVPDLRERQLSDLPIVSLSSRRARSEGPTPWRARSSFTLEVALSERIRAMAKAQGTSALPVVLGAFYALLSHSTGQHDLAVLTTAPRGPDSPGDCREVVLRATLAGHPSFAQLVSHVTTVCARASEIFGRADVGVRAQLGLRFYLLDSSVEAVEHGLLEAGSPVPASEQSWILFDRDGRFEGVIDYDAARFEEKTVARLAAHYAFLLEQMLARPQTSVFEHELLTPAERHTVLHEWNEGRGSDTAERCVHQLVEEQATAAPDAIAVIDPAGKAITYREVNERADQLAQILVARGVKPDSPVGICVERGTEMVVGFLGILKAGAAVLPIDPNYPGERIAFMLEDARADVLVTQKSLVDEGLFPEGPGYRVVLDAECLKVVGAALPHQDLTPSVTPRDLAYVIYTSGSTGTPKGVMVEHRSVHNAFVATQAAYPMGSGDRFLGLASFGSDTAFWQLLAPLSFGGAVVLISNMGDPAEILETIERHRITVIDLVPSLLALVVQEVERRDRDLSSLRALICGGEALTSALLDRASASLRHVAIFNSYGPTETSCQVTFHRSHGGRTVSIGTPLANTRIYLLSPQGKPVPIGVVGEITIGGIGVARGYLNRPELTEANFVTDPFAPTPGARMYRSGDLGRWLESGEIEYLGRTDQQIKINGFRVELGEIEGALREQHGVRDALVVVVNDAHEGRRLVGYVLVGAQESPSTADLRGRLRRQLPSYMIPAAIVPVREWPLTPHGKIDRKALPRPSAVPRMIEDEPGAPRNEVEERLSKAWAELLGLERVGVHDDFFALGGHSLLALRLIAEVHRSFGKELTLRSVFQVPTVATMAAFLAPDGRGAAVSPRPTRERLLQDARLPPEIVAKPPPLREVLLTGATGFLGRHLLHTLLERTTARIHCLVRAANGEQALTKIADALARTGAPPSYLRRVVPLVGDLTRPGFGASVDDLFQLGERVDAVFHLGAAVNHVAPYVSLFDANAKGTLEVLRFAASSRMAPVHFVSTVDVVGDGPEPIPADEPLFCEEPPLGADPYTLTKWVADQLVAQASARGIPACIFRTGYIGPHSQTGDANSAGWFEVYLQTAVKLRSLPDDFPEVGIAPVDAIVDAILELARRPGSPHRAFRLIRDERRVTRETLIALAEGLDLAWETIPRAHWRRRLAEYCADHPDDSAALLGPYLDAVGAQVHDRAPHHALPRAAELATEGPSRTDQGLAAFLTATMREAASAPRGERAGPVDAMNRTALYDP